VSDRPLTGKAMKLTREAINKNHTFPELEGWTPSAMYFSTRDDYLLVFEHTFSIIPATEFFTHFKFDDKEIDNEFSAVTQIKMYN
jgi:hypothetical protein